MTQQNIPGVVISPGIAAYETAVDTPPVMAGGPVLPVPYDPYTNGDMVRWYQLQMHLSAIKDEEMALRKKIAKAMFPDAEDEATHYKDLPDGARLKMATGLSRKIDVATYKASMQSFIQDHEIKVDEVVTWEPKLSMKAYRALSDEQRKFFDQCLTITPSSPSMEIVPAKQKKDPI
jgi:hypothetical protein